MRKSLLLLLFAFSASCSLIAQPYIYNFNGDFTDLTSTGPNLTESLDIGCGGTAGGFAPQAINTTCAAFAPTQNAFNFNAGDGLVFDNTAATIGGSYTIHMLFKFNAQLPAQRVIDFSGGVADAGIYVDNDCLAFFPGPPAPQVFVPCPNYTTFNTFHLLTITRDNGTTNTDLYMDGVLEAQFTGGPDYIPGTSIVFLRDELGGCENGAGAIRFLVIDANPSTQADVTTVFNGICALVLPLNLVDFSANKQNNSVLLKWATESEVNTSHFDVERSLDGRTFSKLVSVPAKNISGRINYNYTDLQPVQGTAFYRLKMFDMDGRFKYSGILKINFSSKQQFEVFPNPARETITISGIQANKVVQVLNAEGRPVLQRVSTGQTMTLDINKLPTGVYIISYSDGESIQRQKIVKN